MSSLSSDVANLEVSSWTIGKPSFEMVRAPLKFPPSSRRHMLTPQRFRSLKKATSILSLSLRFLNSSKIMSLKASVQSTKDDILIHSFSMNAQTSIPLAHANSSLNQCHIWHRGQQPTISNCNLQTQQLMPRDY